MISRFSLSLFVLFSLAEPAANLFAQATGSNKDSTLERDGRKLQIVVGALHQYLEDKRSIPFEAHCKAEDAANGLSWTVSLLPYLGEQSLHDQFDLDSSHDSQVNGKLGRKQIDALVVSSGARIMWIRPDRPVKRIADIHDGTSKTAAFVISQEFDMIPWSQAKSIRPEDVIGQFNKLKAGERLLFGLYNGTIVVATSESHEKDVKALLYPADFSVPSKEFFDQSRKLMTSKD